MAFRREIPKHPRLGPVWTDKNTKGVHIPLYPPEPLKSKFNEFSFERRKELNQQRREERLARQEEKTAEQNLPQIITNVQTNPQQNRVGLINLFAKKTNQNPIQIQNQNPIQIQNNNFQQQNQIQSQTEEEKKRMEYLQMKLGKNQDTQGIQQANYTFESNPPDYTSDLPNYTNSYQQQPQQPQQTNYTFESNTPYYTSDLTNYTNSYQQQQQQPQQTNYSFESNPPDYTSDLPNYTNSYQQQQQQPQQTNYSFESNPPDYTSDLPNYTNSYQQQQPQQPTIFQQNPQQKQIKYQQTQKLRLQEAKVNLQEVKVNVQEAKVKLQEVKINLQKPQINLQQTQIQTSFSQENTNSGNENILREPVCDDPQVDFCYRFQTVMNLIIEKGIGISDSSSKTYFKFFLLAPEIKQPEFIIKSESYKSMKNLIWNLEVEITIRGDFTNEILQIEIMKPNTFSKDVFLGAFQIPLKTTSKNQEIQQEIPLTKGKVTCKWLVQTKPFPEKKGCTIF
ncbi:hypothetical protein M0811_09559 [Anaeramoeba ignava]|uniref:C2 domain-containing protein n=1 Tax=Anaeramoeba ignava TaxID=1746090 RepID=A0A9Q0RAY9_ANAIG|nr:hypothetical protein M0811_09559 [Anaeramoeba ignava]